MRRPRMPSMIVDDHDAAAGPHVGRRRLDVFPSLFDVMDDVVEEGYIDIAPWQLRILERP